MSQHFDPSSPLLRPQTEVEAPHRVSQKRVEIARYIPLAHDERYAPLPLFLPLVLVQGALLAANFIFALAHLAAADALSAAPISIAPIPALTAALSALSMALHIYLLLHKNLPPWKSALINGACSVLWAALTVLRWLSKAGYLVWWHRHAYWVTLTEERVMAWGKGLALATTAVYLVHFCWAAGLVIADWWAENMARTQRDRAAWTEYVRDQDDLLNQRRRLLLPPGRDVEHWGYGYGAF